MQTTTYKLVAMALIALGFISFFSCEGDDDDKVSVYTDRQVNGWIYEQMRVYYLWNDYLPASPNYNQDPESFFESICYWYDKNTNPNGDRFSFIYPDYEELTKLMSGVQTHELGFDCFFYLLDDKGGVIGEIQYVKKNTPAETAGLKRGQVFSEFNGKTITRSNYADLFAIIGSYTLKVHDVSTGGVMQPGYTVNLQTVSNYAENPVYLDSIYRIDNKVIGYLVYNFFSDDSNDKSQRFNIELSNKLGTFKNEGVTDMVVDLRYNSGGTLSSARYLASMLVKGRSTQDNFLWIQYNDLITSSMTAKEKEENLYIRFADKIDGLGTDLPSLGSQIDRLVFLTGSNTASASEMVINGLLPYNNIQLVGDTTVGKNVGSVTFYDEDNYDKNKWAIQPIVVKLSNSDGESDFTAGFPPDIVNLDENNIPKLPLGDTNEPLLKDAINYITGSGREKTSFRSSAADAAPRRMIGSSLERKAWRFKTELKRE